MIDYKVIALADKLSAEETQYKYYPRICNRQKLKLRELSKDISRQCSLTESDVYGVLRTFITNIPTLLLENRSIELDEFGIFRLHAKVEGSDTAKEAKAHKIKELKIAFRPHKYLKQELQHAKFRKVK
ncbi:HU family DNA-binding protein [Lutibacter sp. B2]|nr:HU family DNA-binding protein [Lutibacter sp. B2]